MSHLNKIFAVWNDNAEAFAADIGETGTTVRQWRNRGSIHSDHWPKIIKAAFDKRGKELRFEDFMPPEAVADLPVHIAGANAGEGCASATKADPIIGADAEHAASANNIAENICELTPEEEEADSHGPFSVSPKTCSTPGCTNPACSTGEVKAA